MLMKNRDEKIAEYELKIKQLQAQKRALINKAKEEERKARTKRLIEVGATVESVLGRPITQEELPLLKSFLEAQESRGGYFSKAMSSEPIIRRERF